MNELLQLARGLLAGVTLEQFLAIRPPRPVISVAAAEPLQDILRRFAAVGLVAAPLFADEARTVYSGWIDLMDVVAALVEAARLSSTTSSGKRALSVCAMEAASQFALKPVGSIRTATNDMQVVYFSQLGSSLLHVVREGFASPFDKLACHRLAVFQPNPGSEAMDLSSSSSVGGSSPDLAGMNADGSTSLQLTHIVSQSDMLRFLHRHRSQLGQRLLDSTLTQLGLGEKVVMCVTAEMTVFDALAGIVDRRVPAVAVIDTEDSGLLIGSFSVSDLRGILPQHFEQLLEPVGEFLSGGWRGSSPYWQPRSPQGGIAHEFGILSPEQLPHAPSPTTCTLDSRFGDVLDLLATRHLHRLFLVDSEGRPAGVVSLTDILRLIAGEAEC